ncbi:MAG: HU family DNA-binding protein [Cardiobacteriaceae bacterium]|nr:HU family DNA-binding protein [Cardiobacteriaceae bacterium]
MNKTELVDAIAESADITKAQAAKALEAFLESVSKTLQAKEKVTLIGFGTFEARERAARTGRNPKTLQEISIPASTSAVFKAGKKLKDALNPPASKPAKAAAKKAPAKKK